MDKKRLIKSMEPEDLKGFEEFIEGHPTDSTFIARGVGGGSKKNEAVFEHFTFLINDAERLAKLSSLLGQKLSFSAKFDQGAKLIQDQKTEVNLLQRKMFQLMDSADSGYRKSLGEILDSFFSPPQV
jgi:hypothetical protein